MNNIASHFVFAVAVCGFLLSGCAGVVYKDSATKYSDSAAKLIAKIHEAEDLTAKAQDAEKRAQAAQDRTCPVAEMAVYLRKPVVASRQAVVAMSDRYSIVKRDPACRKLETCMADNSSAGCGRVCLSAEEANCLDKLTHAWTAATKLKAEAEEEAAAKTEQSAAQEEEKEKKKERPDPVLDNYRKVVGNAQIGANRVAAPRIIAESFQFFAGYLDLLDEYADKNASNLKERSTKFANRIKERADLIKNFTGNEVLSETEIAAQQKYVLSFGKLANTLKQLSNDYKDANQIKETVQKNQKEVSRTLRLLQAYARTVTNIGFVKTTSFTLDRRMAIQEAFHNENSAEERLKMFELLEKLPLNVSAPGLDEMFEAFEKSHIALVRLIQNPNEEDLKKLRAQRFEEFKSVATDLASIVKLFI